MASPLSDLDELVLKCRDQKAKDYIREAVACYKAGAFRSSIVSTWLAVSFDIIDKLKELSLAGDKDAEKQIEDFDKARRIGDIAYSLKFERQILVVCRDKLELISPVEFIDLERLQEDRNRCANSSMIADVEIFNPSAELARMHISSAVEYLLQYPSTQGKYALDSLTSEVDSEYFSTEEQYFSDYDHYKEYRDQLIDGEQKVSEGLDKAILAISSAALGLTFALVKSLIEEDSLNSLTLLKWGWLFLGFSMLSVLGSLSIAGLIYYLHRLKCDKIMANRSILINALRNSITPPAVIEFTEAKYLRVINLIFHYLSPIFLMLGVLLIGVFLNLNWGIKLDEQTSSTETAITITTRKSESAHTSTTTSSTTETNAKEKELKNGKETNSTTSSENINTNG